MSLIEGLTDEEALRRWAFDEELEFADQDEDLFLGRSDFVPTLLDLADDPDCPKADYALGIVDFYFMFIVLRGPDYELQTVRKGAEQAAQAISERVRAWGELQERRLAYKSGVGPVDRLKALAMGHDLLNGVSRSAEISIVSETRQSWGVELSAPPLHLYKARLTIDRQRGTFRYDGSRFVK